jgi:hypothetical protein
MLEINRYTRKPFDVDAVQVTADNMEEVATWCQGTITTEEGETYIKVRVLRVMNEKQTRAYAGDWVLYAGTGYKVYTDKAFRKSFVATGSEELRTVRVAVG